jgi:hypothetical protein
MMSEESPDRRRAIPIQRGRKRHKLGGTLQRLWASPRIGPPRSDTRPAKARQGLPASLSPGLRTVSGANT